MKLGAPRELAENDACRIEHVISPEMFSIIKTFAENDAAERGAYGNGRSAGSVFLERADRKIFAVFLGKEQDVTNNNTARIQNARARVKGGLCKGRKGGRFSRQILGRTEI